MGRATVIAETSLHLRETPSVRGKVIAYLMHGETVETFGQADDAQWQYVRDTKGREGFVDAFYLQPLPLTDKPLAPAPAPALPSEEMPETEATLGAKIAWFFIAAFVLSLAAIMVLVR